MTRLVHVVAASACIVVLAAPAGAQTVPTGDPVRFQDGPAGPERVRVVLPADPAAVPRGDR